MMIPTVAHSPLERSGASSGIDEHGLDAEFEALRPRPSSREPRGSWFDLCFRLIILALAALWLLTPPAGSGRSAADEKAVATTQ